MPVIESSLRVYLTGEMSQQSYLTKKRDFFYKYWKQLLVKRLLVKKSTFNFASITNQVNVEDYIFKEILTCSSYQSQLKVYYIFLHPKKP